MRGGCLYGRHVERGTKYRTSQDLKGIPYMFDLTDHAPNVYVGGMETDV